MLDDEHTGRGNLELPTIDVTCARVKPGLALRFEGDVSLAARRCGVVLCCGALPLMKSTRGVIKTYCRPRTQNRLK
ncbi:hypothetical protein [Paraburkholderia fynbosensis]|uniref:Uncharacterized protein n=1 Tax=Paraburkholderia fynbosensis TaxID=1200993 RepID=A0A6J5H0G3_9BURK|nr:hypothetical protein [Paraburkholderia fynbosensis]CAB3808304.1 hypothetical protein LMG27177_06524 [Paraburkholderia fynbosensis]